MNTKPVWQGLIVAITTPFVDDLIDFDAFLSHVHHLLTHRADGLVVCGTTGEGSTLTEDERKELIAAAVQLVDRRVPVIAGVGSNSTAVTLRLADDALKAGADGLLVVTPYYNKPPQECLYRHFAEVARQTDAPIVVYNVPGRTGVSIAPSTLAELSRLPQIVAVKDATGDLRQGSRITELCGDRLTLLSGDDFTALPLMAVGARGAISVVGNVDPERSSRMIHLALEGYFGEARRLHHELSPLNEMLFCTTNPIPVKMAVSLLGFGSAELRLPLLALGEVQTKELVEVMRSLRLIVQE